MKNIFWKMKDTLGDGTITEGILLFLEYLDYIPENGI